MKKIFTLVLALFATRSRAMTNLTRLSNSLLPTEQKYPMVLHGQSMWLMKMPLVTRKSSRDSF